MYPPFGATPLWRFQTKRRRASWKCPADCAWRVLTIGGIIFGPRSIFDPVMIGQRSNFHKCHDFFSFMSPYLQWCQFIKLVWGGGASLQECLPAQVLQTYTRLQTVWSLPDHSRQANKGHSPRCHRRLNGPGRLADKIVQPTTQSAEGCTCKNTLNCMLFLGFRSLFLLLAILKS